MKKQFDIKSTCSGRRNPGRSSISFGHWPFHRAFLMSICKSLFLTKLWHMLSWGGECAGSALPGSMELDGTPVLIEFLQGYLEA